MFVPFETLPSAARVWIYQSEKRLNETQVQFIETRAKIFLDSWNSHGNDLKGSVKIAYNHFVILSIDESFYSASGCSIDKSVHFIQELEEELAINLLDRGKQGYLNNSSVNFFPINEAGKRIASGSIGQNTFIFNNNITTKAELDTKWLVTAEASWLNRFLKKQQLTQ